MSGGLLETVAGYLGITVVKERLFLQFVMVATKRIVHFFIKPSEANVQTLKQCCS